MRTQRRVSPELDLEASLEAAGRAIRRNKGECPTAEALDRFLADALPKEEAERVKSHIATCGVCDLLIEKMKAFEADVAATDDAAPKPRAYRVERRILKSLRHAKQSYDGERFTGIENLIQSLRYFADLMLWCLRRPAFAYVMVLALAYPAYRGFQPRVQVSRAPVLAVEAPQTPSARLPMVAAPPLELEERRGNGSPSQVIKLTPTDSVLILSFVLPTQKDFSYRAEVTNDNQETVSPAVQLLPNSVGYFTLVYDRKPFDPGRYFLNVFKTRPGLQESGSQVLQHEFLVEVETRAASKPSASE